MRRKSPPRVVGPYQERGRWRIVVIENGSRRSIFFPCEQEASKALRAFIKKLRVPEARSLSDVLTAWQHDRLRLGTCKPETIETHVSRNKVFLADYLDRDVTALTAQAAASHYQRYTQRLSLKTGEVISAATQQFDLKIARDFFSWARAKGYCRENPFEAVRPIGRARAGKPQLRIDEARRFSEAAVAVYSEEGNPLAIGVLLALTMGLRTSEILNRVVRDVDDGGKYLWIDAGKSAKARRHLDVPAHVQPLLQQLIAGRDASEPLFGLSKVTGHRHQRQDMYWMTRSLCKRAGTPRVCTHSLRGLWATLAVSSGVACQVVADALGHQSFTMTQKHYAQPAAVTNAGTARVTGLLGSSLARPLSAAEVLEQLDEETVAALRALLGRKDSQDSEK